MKIAKRLAIAVCVYIGIVAAFESLIGIFQPAGDGTLTITTRADDGSENDRVLSLLRSEGQLYVAANHWPRAWYRRALDDPKVSATIDGAKGAYLGVPVTGAEHDRVATQHSTGVMFRVLTGFPPRYFLRLDPR